MAVRDEIGEGRQPHPEPTSAAVTKRSQWRSSRSIRKLRGQRNSGRSSRDQFDDPLHRAKLEHTIAVSRIIGAVVATGIVLATDMPEDLVYEIDARIFRVVSEDAFHTMPMAMTALFSAGQGARPSSGARQ